MIIKPVFRNGKKPDYVFINKYIPSKTKSRSKGFDILYVIVSLLIVAGFVSRMGVSIKKSSTIEAESQVIVKSQKQVKPTPKDKRIEKLQKFLENKRSPFSSLAEYIIKVSDDEGVDWTLISSISGKESTFGIYSRCFNAWGIGGSDFKCFGSWEEGIAEEAHILGTYYRHNIARAIQQKYCPDSDGCAGDWADFVVGAQKEMLAIEIQN